MDDIRKKGFLFAICDTGGPGSHDLSDCTEYTHDLSGADIGTISIATGCRPER